MMNTDKKNNSRGFNSLQHNLHTTNYIFKKSRPHSEIEITGFPTFNSVRVKKQPQKNKTSRGSYNNKHQQRNNQPSSQVSCTNFMKNYIDRLKKQRKRQNKKLKQVQTLNNQRKYNSFSGPDTLPFHKQQPLCNRPYCNQILILEKIKKQGLEGHINTISLVQQNLDEHWYDKQSTRKKPGQLEWANHQKLDKLIKNIRNSRNKNLVAEQLPELTQLMKQQQTICNNYSGQSNQLMNTTLPNLSKYRSIGTARNANKGINMDNIDNALRRRPRPSQEYKPLQPWKQQINVYQFGIEEYKGDLSAHQI